MRVDLGATRIVAFRASRSGASSTAPVRFTTALAPNPTVLILDRVHLTCQSAELAWS